MIKPRKIKQLENLAWTMVGDGRSPNLFFVSVQGAVVTITRDFAQARREFFGLFAENRVRELAVEDRQHGCVLTNEQDEENPKRWVLRDDSYGFGLKGGG